MLHPRNRHQSRYDFKALTQALPELSQFVLINKFQDESIDFANPLAVKSLNRAILKHFYGVEFWDIPEGYLCPPIPGRANYLHYLADLLPLKKGRRVLDIGVGANCVYPLIGTSEYGWNFVGSDIDEKALKNAERIVEKNNLVSKIELRLQKTKNIFEGIIKADEKFDFTICNPPFHSSLEEALAGTTRKWKNLGKTQNKGTLNFGGQSNELWTEGGEVSFVKQMILESSKIPQSSIWFTSLISKEESLPPLYKTLKTLKNVTVKTADMAQGQKKSRLLAWSFSLPS